MWGHRARVVAAGGAGVLGIAAPSAATGAGQISDRFGATTLKEPAVKQRSEFDLVGSEGGLYDDLFFPSWMAGDWNAVQTLRAFSYPRGKKFLGGPSGMRMDVADATIAEENSKVGKSVGPFPLKFLTIEANGKRFVVEDRRRNLQARLDAFAGRSVVRSVEYVELGGANRIGFGNAPLPTTLTYFKGPVVQKTFSNNRRGELSPDENSWNGFEFTRTLFARTNSDVPPVVTDTEILTQLSRDPTQPDRITGKVRVADYLTPQDNLFFEALQQAVTISDYDIELTRSTQL